MGQVCGGEPEQRWVEGGVGRLVLPRMLEQLHHGYLGQYSGAVGRGRVASWLYHCGMKELHTETK